MELREEYTWHHARSLFLPERVDMLGRMQLHAGNLIKCKASLSIDQGVFPLHSGKSSLLHVSVRIIFIVIRKAMINR